MEYHFTIINFCFFIIFFTNLSQFLFVIIIPHINIDYRSYIKVINKLIARELQQPQLFDSLQLLMYDL